MGHNITYNLGEEDTDRHIQGSPSDSPLTQSWEGPEVSPTSKISLSAVRDRYSNLHFEYIIGFSRSTAKSYHSKVLHIPVLSGCNQSCFLNWLFESSLFYFLKTSIKSVHQFIWNFMQEIKVIKAKSVTY